jgi:muconolactone D-isomerase
MLFHVRMDVDIPRDLGEQVADKLRAEEKARAQELQRAGTWRHLWRIVGQYANISVFDVETPDQLHQILTSLPLFPFMKITVTPLCHHPSSISTEGR